MDFGNARRGLIFACAALAACATTSRSVAPGAPAAGPLAQPAVVEIEMEPMKIQAAPVATGGVQIESFDAEELFEHAGKALAEGRHDDAIKGYLRLLDNFPTSQFARPAVYNKGLAQRDKKDWAAALDSFKALVEKYPDHGDAKDALFQMGACFAEMNNWPASGEVFSRLLDRKDLNGDDRVEALARRGFAQFNLGDLDIADHTFRSVLAFKKDIENVERLSTDFFLAFSQYHLGQITHTRFLAAPIRLPETQMDRDLEEKAALLLKAQRAYIETIKYGHPGWASAAGFQVGSLYEELYDAFIAAPIPKEVRGEGRDIYVEELRKKIRILLEKSMRWQRENLLMLERIGAKSDWAEKSKLAYSKIFKLLNPSAALDPTFAPSQAAPPSPAPAQPAAPDHAPADQRPGADGTTKRQIL